ncbi:MAG: CDGSH iron-sulfur domain-containing protein [Bacteroidales bacterium]|nr:CDGSH iron-sulfur domain-containing protein [Bacteroidales bacterium]HRX31631.1 CDGSH iron-sulfur domain-containing protein [Tenuifilaceae bacterium]
MEKQKKIAAKVYLTKGGPLRIEGKFYIVDSQGNDLTAEQTTEAFLCTCGASKNKPFCDDSHKGKS